jgi:hypothetical protein
MEKTEIGGLSLEELEAQSRVELVPERLEMRRFSRRRTRNFVQDCDQAGVLTGIVVINIGGGSAVCFFQ